MQMLSESRESILKSNEEKEQISIIGSVKRYKMQGKENFQLSFIGGITKNGKHLAGFVISQN